MKILTVILARGGSKGIPKKNLSLIGNKPLVTHIIETSLKVANSYEMDVIVSSDSDEIIEVAKKTGAWVPFKRPSYLAEDDVESLPVVKHAVEHVENIKKFKYEIIIYAQPTSPLCRDVDFKSCINALIKNKDLESSVPITEVSTHPFKMKKINPQGYLSNFIDQGFEDMRPRQKLPKVFRRAGSIYVSKRHVIMEKNTLLGNPCLGIEVPYETAIDIDNHLDLQLARILFNSKNHK